MRHGKAQAADSAAGDDGRALTTKGKDEIVSAAQWMESRGYTFDLIATSPKKRARQTADIVAAALGLKDRVAVWDALGASGDLDTICWNLGQCDDNKTVLIVGHEPTLSMLISRIISGTDDTAIVMAKGGLAKIRDYSFVQRPSGRLQWLLTPKQMTGPA